MKSTRPLVLLITLLALVASPMAVAQEPAGADPELDLMFLLDGSGSIDADEWQLQLEGYEAALRDPLLFPLTAASRSVWSSGPMCRRPRGRVWRFR